jgi:hypothetical protein
MSKALLKLHIANTGETPVPRVALSETSSAAPLVDDHPRMVEPPPVRLVTVDDATLIAGAGFEKELDAFYVDLLQLVRDPGAELAYRAANFAIVFQVVEPPVRRQDMRAIGIEVQSLADMRKKLVDAEIEHVLQRRLTPGMLSILLQDPAGNWIELSESAMIR